MEFPLKKTISVIFLALCRVLILTKVHAGLGRGLHLEEDQKVSLAGVSVLNFSVSL